jgi:hypothetical protein
MAQSGRLQVHVASKPEPQSQRSWYCKNSARGQLQRSERPRFRLCRRGSEKTAAMLAVDEPLTLGTNEASRKIEPKVVQADILDNVAVFYLVERQSKHTTL